MPYVIVEQKTLEYQLQYDSLLMTFSSETKFSVILDEFDIGQMVKI